MRKALPITIIFLLLTLSMTPFATAQKKQNIITNETTETLYVIYSSKYRADGDIPVGYRTSGWKTIAAGQQRAFDAFDPHNIYFQIFKGRQPIKPQPATETFAFWINRKANFDIVTQHAINADITRGQLVYSSHDTSVLTHSDGFMQYDNGSRITVTNAWVPVSVKANIITNETNETLYVISSTEFSAQADIPAGYRTSGWKTIAAGQQRAFDASDPHNIYFQIFKGRQPIKPQPTTETFAFWINRNANFDIVTQHAINADITRGQLVYSSHDTSVLTHSDGFMRYDNGSRITVTNAWVAVVESTPNPIVNIPDNTLRRAIERKLKLPANTPITQADMETLTNLFSGYDPDPDGFSAGIVSDLTGLEFATNLKTLDLSANSISDISPLAKLVNLTSLNLSANNISDILPLAKLVNLTSLYLSDNIISDISPLAKLLKLETLNLGDEFFGGNSISDISPLAKLVNLTSLYLSYNAISDFSPIDTLIPNLEEYENTNQRVTVPTTPPDPPDDTPDEGLDGNGTDDGMDDGTVPIGGGMVPDDITVPDDDIPVPDEEPMTGPAVDDGASDLPVNIPDSTLRSAIASELDKDENDPISRKEMLTLTELTADVEVDLTGLEFAFNLEWLDLYIYDISDVSPLKDLVNLETLDLHGNNISDVSPLKDLVNLKSLELVYNNISDVSPLKDLVNLKWLYLDGNNISDVSPLKNLVNLKSLELVYNDISDVSPLKNLVNLEELFLSDNSISDVSPLKDLVNLEELRLDGNPVKNMNTLSHLTADILPHLVITPDEGLSDLPVSIPDPNLRSAIASELGKDENDLISQKEMLTLTYLHSINRQIADLTGLEFARSLGTVYLNGNNISDVSPLKDLVNLKSLELRENAITDVSPLKDLVNLKSLSLSGNSITDVSPLKDLVNLEWLELDGNPVSNINTLSHLFADIVGVSVPANIPDASLRRAIASELGKDENEPIYREDIGTLFWLDLSNRQIADLTGLEFARNLGTLYLDGNSILDVSPLKDLVNLTRLHLHGNSISDVSPLKDLVNLGELRLDGNPVSNINTLSHLRPVTIRMVKDFKPVNIPDANLRSAIASELGKDENEPIFETEMEDLLFWLDLDNPQISDLTGLEFARNLTSLRSFSDVPSISDLSPLEDLVNLTSLYLINNSISDVSPLEDLVNLTSLHLINNSISDVSPLKDLVKLKILDLHGNNISDVSPLKDLVNLESLSLAYNNISDVSPLKDLVNLKWLNLGGSSPLEDLVNHLGGNSISDVSPLKDLIYLESLGLSGNNISDVSPLKDLVNLKTLGLSGNSISDVSPLKDLVNLETLSLRENPVHNADQLSHLTAEIDIESVLAGGGISDRLVSIPDANLRRAIAFKLVKDENDPIYEAEMLVLGSRGTLSLESREIKDLTGLESARRSLTDLRLDHNNISDVSPLKDLVNLEQLYIGHNNISDVSPLRELVNLKRLDLRDNDISDVSPLGGLVNLEYLNLSSNSISDVSPLKDLIKLERLSLNSNGISDVSPLKNLVNLETLWLVHNPVRNADVLSHLDVSLRSGWTLLWSLETPGQSMRDIAFAGRNSDTFFFVSNENEILKARIEGESLVFLESIKVNSDIIDLRIPQENPHFVAVLKEDEYVGMYYTSDLTPRGTSFEGSRGKHKDSVYAMDVSGNGERLVVYGNNRQNPIFSLPVTERILWKFDVSAPQARFYSGVVTSKSKGKVPLPTHIETIAVDFDGKYVYYTSNDGVYSWYGTRFHRRYGASEDQDRGEGGFRSINQQAFQSDVIAYDYPYMVAGYQNPWGRKIIVWDVVNNVSYRTWDISGHIHNIAINGDIVAAIVGSTIHVFNIATDTQEEIYLNVPAASIAIGGGGDYIAVSGTRWDPVNDTISGGLSIARRNVAGAPAAKPASEQPLVETRLGTNYPNPFNPETWIPYNLAKPSEVALTIYAIDGKVVRHLDLGHQAAGYYQSKVRAAHWDGRNAVGERVASGVYFYTLTAGDFSATRKMLILK